MVTIPSIGEQNRISAFLDRETVKIDALVRKVREAIDRLKELRTAVISASVTGRSTSGGGPMNRVSVKPALLRWARKRSGRSVHDLQSGSAVGRLGTRRRAADIETTGGFRQNNVHADRVPVSSRTA